MTHSRLDRLCRHHGITTSYEGPDGNTLRVPDETKRLILSRIGVDPDAPPSGPPAPSELAAPEGVSCYCPDWLFDAPGWGIFCQLYELRSSRDWGIGDLRDLRDLTGIVAAAGADFLGINPMHALFPGDPGRRSPFSPSNRRFLNPIYIAVDDVPGAPPTYDPALAAARAADAVDYVAVMQSKLAALHDVFSRQPYATGAYGRAAHDTFRDAGGEALRRHALFDALSLAMVAEGHGAGWTDWPDEMRDANSRAVAAFAEKNRHDVDFHLWLQWIASVQLDAARDAAREAGMRIGLYLDLAVGEAPDGSATWGAPDLTLSDLTIGAPPDVFATHGQNWALSAPSPRALADRDFAPFRQMIEAQLSHAGALRIDHAMALWQLFLIPRDMSPSAGAHLRYPFKDLVSVLAEQSHRHGAVIIGEDLGFVPEGFRDAMSEARILAYRILYFEQDEHGFKPAADYPRIALACLSTHDLPTLSRWWQAEDVTLRRQHGLVDPVTSDEHIRHRSRECVSLIRVLEAAGALLPGQASAAEADMPDEVLVAAHRFMARTPCLLAGVRLADLVGPADPTNLPGTVEDYPNWKLRSPVPIEGIAEAPAFRAVTRAMREERPRE